MENTQTGAKKKNGLAKTAIIVAIVILMNLFCGYVVSLLYKAPIYEDFVKPTQVVTQITNKDDCLKIGGQWTDYNNMPSPDLSAQKTSTGYCDPNFTKQNDFNAARKVYDRNLFIIFVIVGILEIVLSIVLSNEILTHGFSWSGVVSFVVASTVYWGDSSDLFKVIILAIALAVLIFVAVKKFGK